MSVIKRKEFKMVTVSLQEKNGYYHAVVNYKDDNGKRKQKWFSTNLKIRGNKKEAQAKAEEIRQEFENELNSTQKRKNNTVKTNILFLDFLNEWLKIVKKTIEPSTYNSYEQIVNDRITKYFTKNKIKLVDIQAIDIQEYYNTLFNDGLSANSVIHHHAIIRKALDYAYKMDIIPNNPADKVQRPKKEQYIGSFYNENELNELFEKSKDDPLNLMIRVASYYGLRRSEVLGLKWDAFDFDTKTITIKHTVTIGKIDGKRQVYSKDRTKNKSSYRTLPLIDDIADRLLEFKEQQEYFKKAFGKSYYKKDKDYVFVKPDGKLVRPDYVSEHFKILLNKLGLRHIRFHDLRHSCASLLLAKGIPMKAIQEWLGHSNFSTTANIYAHLDSNSKQLSAQVITCAFEAKKEIEECDSSTSSKKLVALAN